MARNKEIDDFALAHYKDIAGETDYTDTAAFEGIIKGAKWADKTMIDKACKILESMLYMKECGDYDCVASAYDTVEDFIDTFKEYMEE